MTDLALPGEFELDTPGVKSIQITPDDDNDLAQAVKSLWINEDGDVTGILLYDTTPITVTALAGMPLPLCFRRIMATGTTASFIGILM